MSDENKGYYENGQLKFEFLPDGTYKKYYENGKLQSEMFPDGNFKRYNEDGNLEFSSKEAWEDLGLNNEHPLESQAMENPDKGYKTYYKNGELKFELFPDGSSKSYYENGNLRFEKLTDGSSKSYDENGKLKSEETSDEILKTYHENGKLKIEEFQDGSFKSYYENGNLEAEKLTDGTRKYYDENGKLQSEKTSDEILKIYHENGNPKIEHFPDGSSKYYDENGNPKIEHFPDGSSKYYDENGNPDFERLPDGTLKDLSQNDRKTLEDQIMENPDKSSKSYYENGELKFELFPDGSSKLYYENGNLKVETSSDGTRKYYDENGTFFYEQLKDGTLKDVAQNNEQPLEAQVMENPAPTNSDPVYAEEEIQPAEKQQTTLEGNQTAQNGNLESEKLSDGTERFYNRNGQLEREILPDGTLKDVAQNNEQPLASQVIENPAPTNSDPVYAEEEIQPAEKQQTPAQDSTKAYQDFGEILKDTTLTEEEQMWYLNGLIEEEKQQLAEKQQTITQEQAPAQDVYLQDGTLLYTKEEIEHARQTGEYPKLMETYATTERIVDSYGIDQMQSPEQIQANVDSLSSLPTDAECFEDDTFKDVKRLLDSIEVHHDLTPAESLNNAEYNNDMQMFCETVRMQTAMYLANISKDGIKPEDFKAEYADRLSAHLTSVLGYDVAVKSKPTQESISQLLDGLSNGQKHVIEASTLIGWQAAQNAEMNRATDLMAKKPNLTQTVTHWKNKIQELDNKVKEKYPKSYSLAKTALTSAGWGLAFSVGASFGPVGIAAVSAASFANSSYQLYQDYKRQKEEHRKKGEKYNFFSYVKENKLRCLSTMLSGLSVAVGGVSLGGIDASALSNVVSQSRRIVGYAMAASGAFRAAANAWRQTEGSWWDKLRNSARAAVTSAASFAAGYAAGQAAGAVAGDIAGTPAQEQQDTTQNTAQQTEQTLASQTIQPMREDIATPVNTPSQVSQPQVLDAQVMEGTTPPVHETPTAPVHETPTAPVHETPTAPEAGTTTVEAQENPEMPNTGSHVGWMTENGDSYVFNNETQEFTFTPNDNPQETQVISDQETFRDIYTRLQNGEQVSQEDMEWARDHLHPDQAQGSQESQTATPEGQTVEAEVMENPAPTNSDPVYFNEEEGQTVTQEALAQEVPVQDTSVHQAGGMSYSFDENGRLAMQGSPSTHLDVQDQQVTQFQTEDGRTMYRCGATVSPNLGMAQTIEANELRNIAAEHDVYNDLMARQDNGETLSQAEQNFITHHEQQMDRHHLTVDENCNLVAQNRAEHVQETTREESATTLGAQAAPLKEEQTVDAEVMENPAPTNSDSVYFNEEGGQTATPEGQTVEAQENPQMPNTGQYEGHMTDSGVSFVVNHETGELTVSGDLNPELEQAASDLAANSSLSVEQAQTMLRDQEAFKDIATRMLNHENVSKEEMTWARNHLQQLEDQGLHVNNDWSISPAQGEQEGQTITQETPAQEASVQDTSVHQAGGMSYSFDENGRLAIQGSPSSELHVQDQQVTQFQTEDGRTMYRCGATVSPNLGAAQTIENNELRNIAAGHDVYNDLAARQANGETLSQAEQNFMHHHEQQIEQHHLVVTEDGHLRTEAHDARVREAEANAGPTAQNETQAPSQNTEEVEAQNTALPSAKEVAGKAGIQLIGEKAVNLPTDYTKDHGDISIVCDQNDMIVSMRTPDGHTQSVCASLGEDGKYSFQKIDENGNASPMSDKEIKAFQKDVLKPAAKAAEAYHEKSGNHSDLSHSKNISLMQDAAKRGNISR